MSLASTLSPARHGAGHFDRTRLGAVLGLALALLAVPEQAFAACGDGAIDGADACDDGNTLAGDGCGATCAVEAGFACRSQRTIPIVNGSFDVFPTDPGAGWTLGAGDFDWVDGTAFGGCQGPSGDGTRHLDMNGFTRGQLFQDLATVVGERVVVTFLGNANCIAVGGEPCNSMCVKRLTVSVSDTGDATRTAFATSVYDLAGQPMATPWSLRRFEFVARSSMTRLTFTGSDPSAAGPFLDRVRIPQSICDATTCGDGALGAGETCDDGNSASGDGCSASCTTEVGWTCATPGANCTGTCGDGIVISIEECDDGDMMGGDGCSAACEVERGFACRLDPFSNTSVCAMTCGNGALDAGEACDDGNMIDTDACSNTCLRGPGEACVADPQCQLGLCPAMSCAGCYDTAPAGGTDFGCTMALPACDTSGPAPVCVECLVSADCDAGEACSPARTCERTACGDGTLTAPEACDDGNVLGGDGCSPTCTVEMGFACTTQRPISVDNGSFELEPFANGWTLATGSVDWESGTRDGMCWPAGDGERSIDMNGTDRGRIFQDIATVPGELVTVSFLGSANCRETVGDSCDLPCVKRFTVSAHDTAADAPFATAAYELAGSPRLSGWQQTFFSFVARDTTTRLSFTGSDPSLAGPMLDRVAIAASVCGSSLCGDGTVAAGEMCDDGNRTGGDGCGADCRPEIGWVCPPPPMPCTSACGDGIAVPGEGCDDGNTMNGDGCDATCGVEPGFVCLVDPFRNQSVCFPSCGNGTVDLGEECDDGNMVDTDACSNTCRLGPGEPCVVDPQCQLGLCPAMFCIGCYDTAGPGEMDFGCTAALPVCDVSGPAPICIECLVAADCDAGETCMARMCVPVGTDAGPMPDAAVSRDAAAAPDGGTTTPIDAGPRVGGASGGACICGVTAAPARGGWLVCLGALACLVARRRRSR